MKHYKPLFARISKIENIMKPIYFFTFLLSATMLFNGCSKEEQSSAASAEMGESEQGEASEDKVFLNSTQVKTAKIKSEFASSRNISGSITANGVLDVPPQNLISISAPFGGFLKSTSLLPGSKVSRGQAIAVLEHPDFITMQQSYLEDLATLSYLEKEFDRQSTLNKEQVNSKKTFEKAKSDMDVMRARVMGEKAKLKMLHINTKGLTPDRIRPDITLYSPINGYVMQMEANIGAYMSPSDVIFKLSDTGHLHAELTVYEQDLLQLKVGQHVDIQLANERKSRKAEIHLIGREIEGDRTAKIHVHFDEEDQTLIPGTFLTAQIETVSSEKLALPNSAILDFEGDQIIFYDLGVGPDGSHGFQLIEVETGGSSGGFTEIIAPHQLSKQQKIVTQGAYSLLSKMKNSEE